MRKVLKFASFLVGVPMAGGLAIPSLTDVVPSIRVPQMLREGVALSQALFAGEATEAPIWRSGFTSYSVSPGGSRLSMGPGLWVVLDTGREVDLTGVKLHDAGGQIVLVRDGQPLDVNYLVLAVEIRGSENLPRGMVPKGGRPAPAPEKNETS